MATAYVSARDPRIRALLSTRTSPGTVIAEGAWAHRCLLDTGASIEIFVFCPQLLAGPARELAQAVVQRARAVFEVSANTYNRISHRTQPSGLASLVRLPSWRAGDGSIAGRAIHSGTRILVADGIEYATNLGALIRVVDASGAQALFLTNRQARLEHPDVFTASRGTLLTTPVIDFGEPQAAAAWLTREGFSVHLALPDGSSDFRDVPHGRCPTAIVVGSEGPRRFCAVAVYTTPSGIDPHARPGRLPQRRRRRRSPALQLTAVPPTPPDKSPIPPPASRSNPYTREQRRAGRVIPGLGCADGTVPDSSTDSSP